MKQTIWCDACERNEAVDESSAKTWFFLYTDFRELGVVRSNSLNDLLTKFFHYVPGRLQSHPKVKLACGEHGVSKLLARWASTGSLDAPRNAAADPPRRFEDQADGVR